MNGETVSKKMTHPIVRKCMHHLDVIDANDKTKQIVYMYLKAMDLEINKLKKES